MIPDHEAFVESLTAAQATFLWAELAKMKSTALYPIKEALMHRVIGAKNPSVLRRAMVRKFYKPERPIVAVPTGPLPQPRRKRYAFER